MTRSTFRALATIAVVLATTLGLNAQRGTESMEQQVSYRTVIVDGVSIFYREAGPKGAPTILLLHGLPSSSRMFQPLLESMFALDLAHGILAAELDLAIIAEPSENPHLTLVQLETVPLSVVMPADHPAARRGSASIEEFGNVGWMIFPRKVHPVIYDRILDAGRQAAASPVELHHYVQPQEAVQLIAENFGIAFMSKGVAEQIRHPEIAVRPLSEAALHVTTYLVLRADQSSRLVNEFGRALLRKLSPNSKIESASGQLSLGL